jgi:hypothetical protein
MRAYILHNQGRIFRVWLSYDALTEEETKKLQELAADHQQELWVTQADDGEDFHDIYKGILAANSGGDDADCDQCGHALCLHEETHCFRSDKDRKFNCSCTISKFAYVK